MDVTLALELVTYTERTGTCFCFFLVFWVNRYQWIWWFLLKCKKVMRYSDITDLLVQNSVL